MDKGVSLSQGLIVHQRSWSRQYKTNETTSEETKKRATGGNVASSGNGPGGRGTMGNHDGQCSGIRELGSLQFKMKTKDQADMYFKTKCWQYEL